MKTGKYVYDYPRPAVAVDVVCFRKRCHTLEVALIRRDRTPFLGMWALPGGFVEIDEDLPHAALRELKEETGLDPLFIEQFHCFGRPDRDPRGRTISIAYLALVHAEAKGQPGDDARELAWFPLANLPQLAFDHDLIIDRAGKALAHWRQLGRIDIEKFSEE